MRFEGKEMWKMYVKKDINKPLMIMPEDRSPCGLVRRRSGAPAPLRRVLTNPHGGDFFSSMTMSGEGRVLETMLYNIILCNVTFISFHSSLRFHISTVSLY